MPVPIATAEEIGASGLDRPLVVAMIRVDEDGRAVSGEDSILHAVEGKGLFRLEQRIGDDMEAIASIIDDTAMAMGLDPYELSVVDIDFADAPRIPWVVDAQWVEDEITEELSEFGETHVASSSILAQVRCAMSMAKGDENRPEEIVSGKALFLHAVSVLENHHVGDAIPRLVSDRRLAEIVPVVAASAGRGNDAVDELAAASNGSPVGRRGPEGRDGDVLVTFAVSGPGLPSTATTIVSGDEFDRVTKDGDWEEMEYEDLPDLLERASRSVATELAGPRGNGSDEDWSERYRYLQATIMISDIGRIGPLRPFAVFARDGTDVRERFLDAVDGKDAVLRGAMAITEFDMPGQRAFDELESTLKNWGISSEELPFDHDVARSILRSISEDRSGLSPEAMAVVDEFATEAAAYDAIIDDLNSDDRLVVNKNSVSEGTRVQVL